MAKSQRNDRRAALEQPPRGKGAGLLAGILIGLIIGLGVAAAIAWYFNSRPNPFKTADQVPLAPQPAPQTAPTIPAKTVSSTSSPVEQSGAIKPLPPQPADSPAANKPQTESKPIKPTPPKPPVSQPPTAKSDFTFFDILPGEKPARPSAVKLPREVWWLQVAALKEAKDADRLKARLTLLGLSVQVQPVTSGETTLHRVRVGPFKTEDEALGALDTLAENNYEPRLFKEKMDQP